jgi:hypothetical protein
MCDPHFEAASFKGTAEKFVSTLGVMGGILAGLFATVILFIRWEGAGESNIILKYLQVAFSDLASFWSFGQLLPYQLHPCLPNQNPKRPAMLSKSPITGRRIKSFDWNFGMNS